MAKGFFTQCVSLLTNGQTTIEHIKSALLEHGFDIVKETPAQESWPLGGATLTLPFRPDVNGYAAVDVVNHPWPDTMGDPKSDLMIFAAWSMGHFGPFAYPGGLARAQQHAWSWQPGQIIPEGHHGFIRIRISYVFGAKEEVTIFPKNYDPLAEMMFLSRTVLALLNVSGVICYFNPNGEVLRDATSFQSTWDACVKQQVIPLPLWMNIRFFNLNEKLGFMDTIGNGQLEIRDIEAVFPLREYEPGNIDYYLRNVTHYLLDLDREMKSGEAIDGPGENNLSWILELLEQGVIDPPRQVLQLYPKVSSKAVRDSLSAVVRVSE